MRRQLRLAPLLGQRLPQASISAIERSWGGDKRREFDAQEILAFACAFDLPLLWFFLPPPGDFRRLAGTSDRVNELYRLALGRDDQLADLYTRFRELGMAEPDVPRSNNAVPPVITWCSCPRGRRREPLVSGDHHFTDVVDLQPPVMTPAALSAFLGE